MFKLIICFLIFSNFSLFYKAQAFPKTHLEGKVLKETLSLLTLNLQSEIKVYELIDKCLSLHPSDKMFISFGWDTEEQKPYSKTVSCHRAVDYFLKIPILEKGRYNKLKSSLYLSKYLPRNYINAEDWFQSFLLNKAPKINTSLKKMKHNYSFEKKAYPITPINISMEEQLEYIESFRRQLLDDFCNSNELWLPESSKFEKTQKNLRSYSGDPSAYIKIHCDKSNDIKISIHSTIEIKATLKQVIKEQAKQIAINSLYLIFRNRLSDKGEVYDESITEYPAYLFINENIINNIKNYLLEEEGPYLALKTLIITLKDIAKENLREVRTNFNINFEKSGNKTIVLSQLLPGIKNTVHQRLTASGESPEEIDEAFLSIEKNLTAYLKKKRKKEMAVEGGMLAICLAMGFHPIFRGMKFLALIAADLTICGAITAIPRSLFMIQDQKKTDFLLPLFTPLTTNGNINSVDLETLIEHLEKTHWKNLLF